MSESAELQELLLEKLFNLMEKSDSINCLPRERLEIIKDKYRKSSGEQIKKGILMLEKDITEKESARLKSIESLRKNSGKIRELRLIDEKEMEASGKLADEMLKGIGAVGKKKNAPGWVLFLFLALCAAGILIWYFMLRTS